MYEMRVLVDDTGLAKAAIAAGRPFTETAEAVRDSALFVQETWREHVGHPEGKLISWSGGQFMIHKRTGGYEGAVEMLWPFQGIPLAAWVGPLGFDYPGHLETGYPAFDMKPGLLASPKAKTSKDGTFKYIRVPMWYKGGKERAIEEYGDVETAALHGVVRLKKRREHHSEWARFRTVTSNPRVKQAGKWIHPGLKPHPVGKAVEELSLIHI